MKKAKKGEKREIQKNKKLKVLSKGARLTEIQGADLESVAGGRLSALGCGGPNECYA